MEEKIRAAIIEALEYSSLCIYKGENGEYYGEICADYRDEMDNKTAIEILGSNDTQLAFWNYIQEGYMEAESQYRSTLENEVREKLTAEDGLFPNGMNAKQEQLFENLMYELVYFKLPEEHFMGQEFQVNIMVDTGDGNYDYVLNSVYPSYCGECGGRIDDKASIALMMLKSFTRDCMLSISGPTTGAMRAMRNPPMK